MKELALQILKAAAVLYPPISDLIVYALDQLSDSDPQKPLADEVRAVLPEKSMSRRAVDELGEMKPE
jgi:hypothetical protein